MRARIDGMRVVWLASVVWLLIPARPAVAGAQWVGRKFMPRNNARAKIGDREVTGALHDLPLVVTKEDGDWLWTGRAWVRKADVVPLESAAQYYSEFLRANPISAWGYDMRGTVWKTQGKLDEAVKDFSRVIKYAPQEAWGYVARGAARELNGEQEAALKDYAEAIRLAPRSPVPYIYRAALRADRGQHSAALKDYAEALQVDPQSAAAVHFNRGLMFQKAGEFEKALADYDTAVHLDPAAAGAFAGRARIRAACPDDALRDGKLAIAEATHACELSHWAVEPWIDTLAAAYAESGDFDEAIRWQKQAIDLLGNNTAGLYKPAESLERLELYKSGQPYRESLQRRLTPRGK